MRMYRNFWLLVIPVVLLIGFGCDDQYRFHFGECEEDANCAEGFLCIEGACVPGLDGDFDVDFDIEDWLKECDLDPPQTEEFSPCRKKNCEPVAPPECWECDWVADPDQNGDTCDIDAGLLGVCEDGECLPPGDGDSDDEWEDDAEQARRCNAADGVCYTTRCPSDWSEAQDPLGCDNICCIENASLVCFASGGYCGEEGPDDPGDPGLPDGQVPAYNPCRDGYYFADPNGCEFLNMFCCLPDGVKPCIGEGQRGSSFEEDECCPGLDHVNNAEPMENGECVPIPDGSFYCTDCGDDVCGTSENWCRCPDDCAAPGECVDDLDCPPPTCIDTNRMECNQILSYCDPDTGACQREMSLVPGANCDYLTGECVPIPETLCESEGNGTCIVIEPWMDRIACPDGTSPNFDSLGCEEYAPSAVCCLEAECNFMDGYCTAWQEGCRPGYQSVGGADFGCPGGRSALCCAPGTPNCRNDADCGDGCYNDGFQTCVQYKGLCLNEECSYEEQSYPGHECQDGRCWPIENTCEISGGFCPGYGAQCPPGFYSDARYTCLDGGGICCMPGGQECYADWQCGEPYCYDMGWSDGDISDGDIPPYFSTCVQTYPYCMDGRCDAEEEYFDGAWCDGTKCIQENWCRVDNDCGSRSCRQMQGGACQQTTPVCENGQCETTTEYLLNADCIGGSCRTTPPECRDDWQCGEYYCYDNFDPSGQTYCTAVVPYCDSGYCEQREDAIENAWCNGYECVPYEDQCRSDQECGEPYCWEESWSDGDIYDGDVTGSGACVQMTPSCNNGYCGEQEQWFDNAWCDGLSCHANVPQCRTNRECGQAYCWVEGYSDGDIWDGDVPPPGIGTCVQVQPYCQSGLCMSDEEWIDNAWCDGQLCHPEEPVCRYDYECGQDYCYDLGYPTDPTAPDMPPPIPSTCVQVDVACRNGNCISNEQYMDYAYCNGRYCEPYNPGCQSDSECGMRECWTSEDGGCYEFVPLCLGGQCEVSEDYMPNAYCDGYACVSYGQCRYDAQCGDSYCIESDWGGCEQVEPFCDYGRCNTSGYGISNGRCLEDKCVEGTPYCRNDYDCGYPSCWDDGVLCFQYEPYCVNGQCSGSEYPVEMARCDGTWCVPTGPECRFDRDCGRSECWMESDIDCYQIVPDCVNGMCNWQDQIVRYAQCDYSTGSCVAEPQRFCEEAGGICIGWGPECPNGTTYSPNYVCDYGQCCMPVGDCLGEGEVGYYWDNINCCSGLDMTENAYPGGAGECYLPDDGSYVCIKIDGWCNENGGENWCNSPDCEDTPFCASNADCPDSRCYDSSDGTCITDYWNCDPASGVCLQNSMRTRDAWCDFEIGQCRQYEVTECEDRGGYCGYWQAGCNSGYEPDTGDQLGCPGGRSALCCLPVVPECYGDADCLGRPWNINCPGHWDCEGNQCVEQCGDPCGDGTCAYWEGEDTFNCWMDCNDEPECEQPSDCLDHYWGIYCQGHWTCNNGDCTAACGWPCGDGVCSPEAGETETTCQTDCNVVPRECWGPDDCMECFEGFVPGQCMQQYGDCTPEGQCIYYDDGYEVIDNAWCNYETGMCERVDPTECRVDSDCGQPNCYNEGGYCIEETPYCSGGQCASYGSGQPDAICNPGTGQCEPFAVECRSNEECGDPKCETAMDDNGRTWCLQTKPYCADGQCLETQSEIDNAVCNYETGLCGDATPLCVNEGGVCSGWSNGCPAGMAAIDGYSCAGQVCAGGCICCMPQEDITCDQLGGYCDWIFQSCESGYTSGAEMDCGFFRRCCTP